ncbi:MAG: Uma2 family endonuclease [Anaerolineae bacterium]
MKPTSAVEAAEPAWDVAYLFPRQGTWSEEEYLSLETNHLVEFSHGHIEVLPMPTEAHQLIVAYLYDRLLAFLRRYRPGAMVLFAPLPVRLWAGKYREPDLMVMLTEHADRRHQQYWEVPDLVIEVVSPDYRRHDLETKRREYAQAGIPEYWIVDPDEEQITVLTLEGERYAVHGVFKRGMMARSALLAGFEVAVDKVWAAACQ